MAMAMDTMAIMDIIMARGLPSLAMAIMVMAMVMVMAMDIRVGRFTTFFICYKNLGLESVDLPMFYI